MVLTTSCPSSINMYIKGKKLITSVYICSEERIVCITKILLNPQICGLRNERLGLGPGLGIGLGPGLGLGLVHGRVVVAEDLSIQCFL